MHKLFKRRKLAIFGVLGVLAIAGAAVAYFTAGGSGTGTGNVGTSSALTLHGTAGSTLYPGTSSSVSFTVDNPSSGHQQVGTIHLASIKAVSSGGTEITSCESVETGATDTNTANFWMPDVVSSQDVPGNGTAVALTATGTLTMNNLSTSQDSCKNAILTLNFTS